MANSVYLAEIPTFVRSDGNPDFEAVRRSVGRLAQSGYPRIAVAGPVGEYENLTLDDQRKLIECAIEAAGDRAEIAAGAFDAGTEKAAARIAEHKALGCKAHLCIASHFFGLAHSDELTRHFAALAEADGNLILMDSTAHTGFALPEEFLPDAASMDGVSAVYVNAADPLRVRAAGGNVLVREELSLTGFEGAPMVSRLAVLFPALMQNIDKTAAPVRDALLTILQTGKHPAAAVKYAAYVLGLCDCPDLLPPVAGLTGDQKRQIEAAVRIAQAEEERLRHGE